MKVRKEVVKFCKTAGHVVPVYLYEQYVSSDYMKIRNFDSSIYVDEEIKRSTKKKGVKNSNIDKSELLIDNFDYFVSKENKKALEDEYWNELVQTIGESKAELFCRTIRDYWFEGFSKRTKSIEILGLKSSVKKYLFKFKKVNTIKIHNDINTEFDCLITADDIDDILKLNQKLMNIHLQLWHESKNNYLEISSADIFLRRGIYCDENMEEYKEWDYINSYSLAFSVSEKFVSPKKKTKQRVILNMNYSDLCHRILFFSPFIRGMDPMQLEVGIIPHTNNLEARKQGVLGGIVEYNVGFNDYPDSHDYNHENL